MKTELVKAPKINGQVITGGTIVPAIIADAGEKAGKRFIEFLTATIRNANTREAYARAIGDFFLWCERHRLTLTGIEPVDVAAYIEALTKARSLEFDIAILDVKVGGNRIDPVADVVAARSVPFIFATGYGNISLPAGHESRIALAKPYAFADLEAALHKGWEERQEGRDERHSTRERNQS